MTDNWLRLSYSSDRDVQIRPSFQNIILSIQKVPRDNIFKSVCITKWFGFKQYQCCMMYICKIQFWLFNAAFNTFSLPGKPQNVRFSFNSSMLTIMPNFVILLKSLTLLFSQHISWNSVCNFFPRFNLFSVKELLFFNIYHRVQKSAQTTILIN